MLFVVRWTSVQGNASFEAQTQESIPDPPSIPDPKPLANDLAKDPVFQEFKKAFLNRNSDAPQPSRMYLEPVADIEDTRWHAVEKLLSAARELEELERGYRRHHETDRATKIRQSILAIREQAAWILCQANPDKP
jgi:hypothetical protein